MTLAKLLSLTARMGWLDTAAMTKLYTGIVHLYVQSIDAPCCLYVL